MLKRSITNYVWLERVEHTLSAHRTVQVSTNYHQNDLLKESLLGSGVRVRRRQLLRLEH